MPAISPRQPAIPDRTAPPGHPARPAHSLAGHGRCSWSSHIPLQWPRSSLMAQPMMGTGTLLIAPVQRSAPERCPRPLCHFMPESRFRSGRRLGPGRRFLPRLRCTSLLDACSVLPPRCALCLSHAFKYGPDHPPITWLFLAQPGLQISRLSGKRGGSFGN